MTTLENNLPTQPPFDDELVETFFKFPEGHYFDCKRLGKLDRVIETVVAFANADEVLNIAMSRK